MTLENDINRIANALEIAVEIMVAKPAPVKRVKARKISQADQYVNSGKEIEEAKRKELEDAKEEASKTIPSEPEQFELPLAKGEKPDVPKEQPTHDTIRAAIKDVILASNSPKIQDVILGILNKVGANKVPEVKDIDIESVVAKIKEL